MTLDELKSLKRETNLSNLSKDLDLETLSTMDKLSVSARLDSIASGVSQSVIRSYNYLAVVLHSYLFEDIVDKQLLDELLSSLDDYNSNRENLDTIISLKEALSTESKPKSNKATKDKSKSSNEE